MDSFNVIVEDINRQRFTSYDVLPALIDHYNESKVKPKTFDEFKEFIKSYARWKWWAACEWEIIISCWPPNPKGPEEKIDVYQQVMMNIDIVTKLLMKNATR